MLSAEKYFSQGRLRPFIERGRSASARVPWRTFVTSFRIRSLEQIVFHEGNDMEFSSALKLNHIFRRLYATAGQANGCLVLYARRNRTGTNRIGITVGKKLGHAVVRNRARRRIREVYRLNEDRFQPGWDIVVVARSKSVTADFAALTAAFLSLAEKAGILREVQP